MIETVEVLLPLGIHFSVAAQLQQLAANRRADAKVTTKYRYTAMISSPVSVSSLLIQQHDHIDVQCNDSELMHDIVHMLTGK